MCGIVGVVALGHFEDIRDERVRQDSMIYFTTELLQLTQARGKEATGLAVSFEDGHFIGLKMGVAATDFVSRYGDSERHYNKFIEGWRKRGNSRMVVGHCRKPSVGAIAGPEDNMNNHPIKVGETVGVHNGTLTNHEEIFKNLNCGRDGKVDSEAIFRLVNHYSKNGDEPFTKEMILEICKRIGGAYSCLTFNGNNPFQMAIFRDGRPVELLLIKPLKLLLIASEKDYLKRVLFEYNKQAHLYQTSKRRFATLKQENIDFESMSDNTLLLLDTNTEVGVETKVTDLYDSEKIPTTGKLWGKVSKVLGGAQSWQQNHTGAQVQTFPVNGPKTPHTEVSVNPKPAGSNTASSSAQASKGLLGMVMNKRSGRFESKEDIEESKKHGNVILDAESNQIVDALTGVEVDAKKKQVIALSYNKDQQEGSSDRSRFELENTYKDLDDLITDPAKVSEIIISSLPAPANNFSARDIIDVKPEKIVDMSVDAEALEEAIDASKKDANFSTDIDVINTLDISSITTLEQMPMYSFGNKVKKWAFQRGWYAGFLAKKKQQDDRSLTPAKALSKYRKGTEAVKGLKVLLRIVGTLADDSDPGLVGHVVDAVLADSPTRINMEAIASSIKATDINNAPILRTVLEKINETEKTG